MHRQLIKPAIFGALTLFVGSFISTFFELYIHYPHIDKLFHVLAGLAVAWFFGVLWRNQLALLTRFQRFMFLISLTTLIGFTWEVLEWSSTVQPIVNHPLLRHYLAGGDLTDTLGDLVADIFGGALFGFFFG